MNNCLSRGVAALFTLALVAIASPAAAQQTTGRDGEFRWAKAIPAGSLVRVANVRGDVSIVGADIERVELVAVRHGPASDSDARVEVKEHAGGVTICALRDDDSYCDESGMHDDGGGRRDRDRAWYEIEVRVPRRMRISTASVSGDVSVSGTSAEVRATSVSGDVRLDRIRASEHVRATTVSGDVTARLESVARGTEMEMKSVSGDVRLSMPERTGFDLEISTVSGDLNSDFALAMRGRFNRRRINAQINDGGSDLRISTVSGDVRLAHN